VSENSTVEKNSCTPTGVSCCVWSAIVALVFLRLCIGWHFFSEGIKKVEHDTSRGEWKMVFSAEGFLNGAKGPLAPFFQNQAPTTHKWRDNLVVAKQLDPAKSAKLSGWVASYVKRRQGELKNGKPTDAQFADFSPAATWGEQIRADWQDTLKRFKQIKSLSKEQLEKADEAFKKHERYLADFLAEEALAIEAYQHEIWRLETAKQTPAFDEVPFEIARVSDQQATVDRTPGKWVAQAKSLDEGFADELRGILTVPEQDSSLANQVDAAVANREVTKLNRMNVLITCVVTGVGICLMLGLFTRVAAVVGALFLLSVMASQPPWVAGANAMFFYYQLVEFAALIYLAAIGAGQWAGLDFIIQGLWSRRQVTPKSSAQGVNA
jgi:uncharacterized membrane protein YphA (DoxX/SURF4 family)